MPMYETPPGQLNIRYIKADNGMLVVTDPKEEDPKEKEKRYASISGNLDLLRIEYDPGSPMHSIEPYEALVIHLTDEEILYRIKMNLDRNFSFSFAQYLNEIKKGDEIMLTTTSGDKPKITFCNVKKKVDDNFIFLQKTDLPKDRKEKLAVVKDIITNHSAYSEKVQPEE